MLDKKMQTIKFLNETTRGMDERHKSLEKCFMTNGRKGKGEEILEITTRGWKLFA
jgi:hypothetical protein